MTPSSFGPFTDALDDATLASDPPPRSRGGHGDHDHDRGSGDALWGAPLLRRTVRAPLHLDLAGAGTDTPDFARTFGGAVLALAIQMYARASAYSDATSASRLVTCDAPAGMGLGGIQAMAVAEAGLRSPHMLATPDTRLQLAEAALATEQATQPSGFVPVHDAYMAALGGVRLLTVSSAVHVMPAALFADYADALCERLLVCDPGGRARAYEVQLQLWERYRGGDPVVLDALFRMRAYAMEMGEALQQGDVDALGPLMDQHWSWQRRLVRGIEDDRCRTLLDAARAAGALSGRALGVGGGCLLLLCRRGMREGVLRALEARAARAWSVRLDPHGAQEERPL